MKLKIVGSSSRGNSYILENKDTALLLEAGVRFKEIKEALDFNISKVVGCLITHEHGDHAKYMKDVLNSGVKVYTSLGTIRAMDRESHSKAIAVEKGIKYKIGDFTVLPFGVKHDCADPLGFLIRHPEMGDTLFATDTYYIPFYFKNLNNIMLEINYSQEILDDNVLNGRIQPFVRNRVMESHLSLETAIDFFNTNDLKQVNNIVLLHLSDGNSDNRLFQREITKVTGKRVTVADKNMVLNFNITGV